MSNFEEKYNNWQTRMSKKTEAEKHRYALTVSFLFAGIVFFFIASNWYFKISGDSFNSSFFTDIENIYNDQKNSFSGTFDNLSQQKNHFMNVVNQNQSQTASTTTTMPENK